VESSPQASFILDKQGSIHHLNRSAVELFGLNIDDLLDRSISTIIELGPEDETGFHFEGEKEGAIISNGRPVSISNRCLGTLQQPLGFACFLEPLEQALARQLGKREQKLASIGTLAGEIAHDLNNMLTGILGHVSFLRLSATPDSEVADSIRLIEEGTRRASKTTQRILQFARDNNGEFSKVNFTALVEGCAGLMQAALPKNISFQFSMDSDEPIFVEGEESALSQLLINLIVNARDAQPEGGKILIDLKTEEFSELPDKARETLKPSDYLRLKVTDFGMGIEPKLAQKIFQPFFTTKLDKGTGLGLATVTSVVQRHEGYLHLESELATEEATGQTSFFVWLRASNSQLMMEEESSPLDGTANEGRILVVDDEDSVRLVMSKSLELLGYEVETAADGLEALEIFKTGPERFSLVILDMMMPHMAGDEVFVELKKIKPDVAALVASGYSSDEKTRSILDNGGLGFLQKPFGVEELAKEVKRCLAVASSA